MTAARAMAPRRSDPTGRSGEIVRLGRVKRWKMEPPFFQEPRALLESPGYRRLSLPAFKVLAFLKIEHIAHAGTENGLLKAPHEQLRKHWRISPRKICEAFDMLEAFGLIRRTGNRYRHGGREGAMTYALTWLPTADGELPTEEYRAVSRADVDAYLASTKAVAE